MASKPTTDSSPSGKGKRKILSIMEKLEVICDSEKGLSRSQIREKYGLKKTTVHDILKAKEKVKEAMKKIETWKKGNELFRTRKLPQEDLDAAVYKWYTQQKAEGTPVRGIDIQHAAHRLAGHLGYKDFKCSDGWLWRFRRRHGIVKASSTGELLTAGLHDSNNDQHSVNNP